MVSLTGVFKDMKPELEELQQQWGPQLQAAKAPKGTPGAPWPVKVLLTIPQPKKAADWDVYELKVLLTVDGAGFEDPGVFKVICPQKDLPEVVRDAMAARIQEQWRGAIAAAAEAPRWRLKATLDWCEEQFGSLLRSVKECTDSYIGVDGDGVTMRRWTVIPPKEPEKEESSEDEVELTPEQIAQREKLIERRLEQDRQRRIREAREEEERAREAERKKQEAMAAKDRGEEVGGPKQLSKKELAEKKKGKQGVRTAKTGSRATKYAGPGSALEKKEGKKKKG